MAEARQVEQWSEKQFCRNRFHNFLGSDIPSTIACKELVDNMTDQIIDLKTPYGYFEIEEGAHSVTALDGGKGISLRQTVRKDTEKTSTFLYLAIAKLYSSTNYDDEKTNSNITGLNGVGTKLNNFLSYNFTAGVVATTPAKHKNNFINAEHASVIYQNQPETKVKGYHFQNGEPTIDGTTLMSEATPEWINIQVPHFYGREDTFGYMVHADYDDTILADPIDIDWIHRYLRAKVGQAVPKNEDIYVTFVYPTDEGKKMITYVRALDPVTFKNNHKKEIENGTIELLSSWDEIANTIVNNSNGEVWGPIVSGYYKVIFAQNADYLKDINNMAQGAIVENSKSFSYSFTIGQNKVSVPVHCAFCLSSPVSKGIGYSDQTKRTLKTNNKTPQKLQLSNLVTAFEKCSDAKNYFESIANAKALGGTKKIRSDAYWEAQGGVTAREYFGYYIDKLEDALNVLKRIENDPDVIKYAAEHNIDIEALKECLPD